MNPMIKISRLGDWGLDDPGARQANYSQRGLLGHDLLTFRKVAGESFAEAARGVEFEPGLHPVYQTALASTESHGYNRNGDGYRAQMLSKRAGTFVSNGRLYRNHQAKDPLKSYGIIKLAQYDPQMGVVHLLGGLFENQATADKYGGGNVADEELEALAKEGSYPVSQGSSIIGGDKCVICGKVSTQRSDYCTPKSAGGQCDLFGCRDGLSKIAEDGRHQALDNPDGIFHDCSKVGFGADRQAFGYQLAPGDVQKIASGEIVPGFNGGAWLADVIGATGPSITPEGLSHAASLLHKQAQLLAGIENRERQELLKQGQATDLDAGLVADEEVSRLAKDAASDQLSRWHVVADTCANRRLFIPPVQFFKACGLADGEVAAAMTKSATLFGDLLESPERFSKIAALVIAESPILVPFVQPSTVETRQLSLDESYVQQRALEKLASGETARVIKVQCNLSRKAEEALDKYAAFQLRVISKILVSKPKYAQFAIRAANLY